MHRPELRPKASGGPAFVETSDEPDRRISQRRRHRAEVIGLDPHIAVSEHLIQKETPVPLAKVLKEFGRAGNVKLDR